MAKKKRKKKATPKHPPEVLRFVNHVIAGWNKGPAAKYGRPTVPHNLTGYRDMVAQRYGEEPWQDAPETTTPKVFLSLDPLAEFYRDKLTLSMLVCTSLRGEEAVYDGKFREKGSAKPKRRMFNEMG